MTTFIKISHKSPEVFGDRHTFSLRRERLPRRAVRLSPLLRIAKVFFPISYYSLPWQTVVVNGKKELDLAEKRG